MKFLTAAAIVALFATPVAVTAQDWAGAYGGLTLGASSGQGTHAPLSSTAFGSAATDNGQFGLVAGYAFDRNGWVWGPELRADLGGGQSGLFTHSSGSATMTLETKNITSLSLRAGRAFDKIMVSGSLGFALVGIDMTFTSESTANALVIRDSAHGLVAGVAVDYDLGGGWRLRGEARTFDGLNATNPDTQFPASNTVLGAAERTYDHQDLTIAVIRNF